jgi:hypothetical protein
VTRRDLTPEEMTQAERALVGNVRAAIHVTLEAFGDAVARGDDLDAERWARRGLALAYAVDGGRRHP